MTDGEKRDFLAKAAEGCPSRVRGKGRPSAGRAAGIGSRNYLDRVKIYLGVMRDANVFPAFEKQLNRLARGTDLETRPF